VLLPLARPSLAAGLALVMMEVLTDFATVQYFGVRTVSVGVYSVWKGTYDFASAVQLSTLVLLFAVAVLAGERLMRGRARFTQAGRGTASAPEALVGWRGWSPWRRASSCRYCGWSPGLSTASAPTAPRRSTTASGSTSPTPSSSPPSQPWRAARWRC